MTTSTIPMMIAATSPPALMIIIKRRSGGDGSGGDGPGGDGPGGDGPSGDGLAIGKGQTSLSNDNTRTEHSEATVRISPGPVMLAPSVTGILILAPPLTQSSIREMREPLSVSEVPSSLARYVTYVGDSG